MTRPHLAHLSKAAMLTMGALVACSAAEPEEATKQSEQSIIRDPNPESLRDATGGNKTPADPSVAFDSRRDAFEDEDASLGEDPDLWKNQTGGLNRALHGNRPQRQYGFQWLRSYARNASIAIFQKQDFIPDNGDFILQPMRDSPDPSHKAEMQLNAKGFDPCPEEHFADQLRGGVNATPICAGTLIDKNLILTAAHCVHDTGDTLGADDFAFKQTVSGQDSSRLISNVRVAFNYVLSERGQQIRLKPGRDVFQVREVLGINAHPVDMSILQLLDADTGQPIDSLDPMYQPVPLYESSTPPLNAFRAGANIGVGVRLPQKISTTRSWGWLTDPEFLGITIRSDIFNGDSGGGVYDVDTGALIGLMHAETAATAIITCPVTPATQNPWPFCPTIPVSGPNGFQSSIPLFTIPRFTGNDPNGIPISKGCGRWVARPWPPEEQNQLEKHIENAFSVVNAQVSAGSGEDGLAVSINAVRKMACGPANSSAPFATSIPAAAAAVVALKTSITPNDQCSLTTQSPNGRCPSRITIGDLPIPSQGPLFNTFNEAQAKQILSQSRLCTGTVPAPRPQLYSDLPQLSLENGRETTVHGNTSGGADVFETAFDNGNATPDALYRIQADDWTLLYADTFSGGLELGANNPGTAFDTSLFLMEVADDNDDDPLIVPSAFDESTPAFDDSRCSADLNDVSFRTQTQLTHVLQPGKKYVLGVTGFSGASGHFNLHVQSAPAPRVGLLVGMDPPNQSVTQNNTQFDIYSARPFVAAGETEENCVDQNGPFDPTCLYNSVPRVECQAPQGGDLAGEFGFISVSCPLSKKTQFDFRVEGESFPFVDPVGAYWEGMQRHSPDGYLCSDDTVVRFTFPLIGTVLRLPSFSSEIGGSSLAAPDSVQTRLSSGAGLRVFYAHQFKPFLDWQRIGYNLKLPRDSFHDIWHR